MDTEATKIALRVLTAISEHRQPASADVEALKKFVPGKQVSPDELACEIIQETLKRRAAARKS